ncbi:5-(carboxyamino)imidazole ribonucleotide synthase [Halodesulfurarchaeum sp. HSR-GB]|uniref:5-(carboxyamino)imidazole ribonucleotide synthase n=1 Tax=Halodesulfurarchaeum sp. HSR-GB TaxID=3074077 RepID=UPI0028655B8D|nr:5-(carboxyamino)imidazole ribonucleotide synthase [Halodesulfurarchaeum sp. HSR-GB]MDR5657047.1 5-(carboxyamino)imidazole ribonucleotide synthase [Halodesulfurarchaeum sp. HSR-GB]
MTDSLPETTLGIVGGGQLGRMLGEAASPLGVETVVLDPTPDCPAFPPAADQIEAAFDDQSAVQALAERVDTLTLEIELADPESLEAVAESTGTPVHPAPQDLRVTRDKLTEKETLDAAGIPVAPYRGVDSAAELESALAELGSPLMLKARTGGYDGRGNAIVDSVDAATAAFGSLSGLVAESLVDFERELSVIGVRGDGETATYPVGENVHEEEILRETLVPARTTESRRERASEVARSVLSVFEGRGVFGIELFETSDGEILVNEIAPRPHNSGHYTIEGAVTSQFEQHVRAVLGLPLGSTTLREPTAMANLLGDGGDSRPVSLLGVDALLGMDGVHLHWYGKREVRPLRKLGHVTTTGSDLAANHERVKAARETLRFGPADT